MSGYYSDPSRVWSRTQHSCSFAPDLRYDDNFASIQYEQQMRLKGNILQYKKNSLCLTKQQRYAKIANGTWASRGKTWATQTETYSNPNTLSLLRVNYRTIETSNALNPFYCDNINVFKDGGSLVCNVKVNPCSGEIIERNARPQTICHPNTDSDVPGPITMLCWKNGTQTWYPRQTYIMTNSGNKWPTGYKALVSARLVCKKNTV